MASTPLTVCPLAGIEVPPNSAIWREKRGTSLGGAEAPDGEETTTGEEKKVMPSMRGGYAGSGSTFGNDGGSDGGSVADGASGEAASERSPGRYCPQLTGVAFP